MRNVANYDIKTCIFKELREFKSDLKNIFGEYVSVYCDYEGLYIDYDEHSEYAERNILELLSEYYDTYVTSIHIDDFTPVGVWIVYKEKPEETKIKK